MKAPADYLHHVTMAVYPSRIPGEPSLAGRIKAVQYERYPDLPSVCMPGQDQVESEPLVCPEPFRSVGQQYPVARHIIQAVECIMHHLLPTAVIIVYKFNVRVIQRCKNKEGCPFGHNRGDTPLNL